MNIVYLKYAVAIAKAGSLSKAAEELYIAQPNLSRAIKEFEKELDTVIFDRTKKGITLTEDGERLIDFGKRILKEIDDVERDFKENRKPKKIFSLSVPRASYISEAFIEFSKQLSKQESFEIYYKETNALKTINNILEKDYKLGIIRYAEQYDKYFKELLENKNLTYELISEFKCVLIMGKDSPLAELDEILPEDLENYIEIAHADPYVPTLSQSKLRQEELPDGIKRRIFVYERASELEILSTNYETFMWVSPMPENLLNKYNLLQRECLGNHKIYKDLLIYPKDYRLSRMDKAFITELCNCKRKYIKNQD